MLYPLLMAVSDLGDSAVLSAMVIATSLYFFLSSCRSYALAIITSFATAAVLIALLKIIFLSCGSAIHSPSGHTALSTAVYGLYAALLARQLGGWKKWVSVIFLISLIAFIAWTRTALHFHSPAEVAIGLVSGIIAVLLAYAAFCREKTPVLNIKIMVVTALIAAILFYGVRMPAEQLLAALVSDLKLHTHLCRKANA